MADDDGHETMFPAVERLLNRHHEETMGAIEALNHSLNRRLTIMDATIKATLDKITALKSTEDSWAAAMDLIKQQVATQTQAIADLQAAKATGTDVTADDLTALAAGNATLDEIIGKVPAAAAANTTAAAPSA